MALEMVLNELSLQPADDIQTARKRMSRLIQTLKSAVRWHLRLTPGAWRLYFIPLPETSQMIIGYIGPHLRTVKYH